MEIKKIRVVNNDLPSRQSIDEKLEVLREKINEIIEHLHKK